MAMQEILLQCECGSVEGKAINLNDKTDNRVVCYCDDCQAYAHYLGNATKVLDKNGGTDIYQLTPSQFKLTKGQENIACLTLSPKGLLRWYCKNCKSPIANTVRNPKVPFTGIPHTFIKDKSRDEILGPVRMRIQGRFKKGTAKDVIYDRVPLKFMLRYIKQFFSSYMKSKYIPSSLYDFDRREFLVASELADKKKLDKIRAKI